MALVYLKDAKQLLASIEQLKQTEVKDVVGKRIREFEENGRKPSMEIFKELCFCILCANFTAERSMKIQTTIGDGFSNLPEQQLAQRLRCLGHRFPNTRARYIVEARRYKNSLEDIIVSSNDANGLREWLIDNVKGIGRKEASHFLRNIGYKDFAILDFHVLNILDKYGLPKRPKTMTKKRYLEIEELLGKIARKASLDLAELDLYLWYMETGKVLK